MSLKAQLISSLKEAREFLHNNVKKSFMDSFQLK